MTESPIQLPPTDAVEYGQPPRVGFIRRVARVVGVAVVAFGVMFIPIFFAGGSSFEQPKAVWWAWPATAAVALPLAAIALFSRKCRPHVSAGIWIGLGLGLLLAGMCFSGM